jgi:hypothetical protein
MLTEPNISFRDAPRDPVLLLRKQMLECLQYQSLNFGGLPIEVRRAHTSGPSEYIAWHIASDMQVDAVPICKATEQIGKRLEGGDRRRMAVDVIIDEGRLVVIKKLVYTHDHRKVFELDTLREHLAEGYSKLVGNGLS